MRVILSDRAKKCDGLREQRISTKSRRKLFWRKNKKEKRKQSVKGELYAAGAKILNGGRSSLPKARRVYRAVSRYRRRAVSITLYPSRRVYRRVHRAVTIAPYPDRKSVV